MLNWLGHTQQQWYRLGQIVLIAPSQTILCHRQYQHCIDHTHQCADLTYEQFQNFYHIFLNHFAEYAQSIPQQWDEALGSLLSQSMLRGVNTLHLFVSQFPDSTPLERFALFTASVLYDVASIVTQQRILITDDEGNTLQIWQPFSGPMTQTSGRYYRMLPLSAAYRPVERSVRVLLARQIVGEHGFSWIASNAWVFAEWLDALDRETGSGGGRLLLVIQRYRRAEKGIVDHVFEGPVETQTAVATEYGEQFYQWLLTGLQDGSIPMNRADAHVHMTPAGLFLELPAIFKTFAQMYHIPVNFYVLFTRFGNFLGLTKKGGGDYKYEQVFSEYPLGAKSSGFLQSASRTIRDGVVVDPRLFFLKTEWPTTTPHIKTSVAHQSIPEHLIAFRAEQKKDTNPQNN